MKRELRYIVVKINDANKYLSPAERDTLERLSAKCALGRIDDGKRLLECVCVESDWPEYEPTWAAIAARMDGAATPTPDAKENGELLRKLVRVADIADLYMGPPCNNPKPVPDDRVVLEYQHGDDEVTITLGECRRFRAAKSNSPS